MCHSVSTCSQKFRQSGQSAQWASQMAKARPNDDRHQSILDHVPCHDFVASFALCTRTRLSVITASRLPQLAGYPLTSLISGLASSSPKSEAPPDSRRAYPQLPCPSRKREPSPFTAFAMRSRAVRLAPHLLTALWPGVLVAQRHRCRFGQGHVPRLRPS